MERHNIRRLTGMRDLFAEDALPLSDVQGKLQHLFSLHGYHILDTPLLEETELFLLKSGGELAARLYAFTDPGGHRVSLRPEFTSSVIRCYLQRQDLEPLPLRWQYAGPVFRFEPVESGTYRQFTQLGAELIGAPGPQVDAEVLALAWHSLSELGVSGHSLHLGHLGVLHEILEQYHLPERAVLFLVGSVGQLRAGNGGLQQVRRRGEELGLLRPREEGTSEVHFKDIDEQDAMRLVQGFLQEAMANPVGSRAPDEILYRYLRKMQGAEDPASVERALEFLSQLAQVRGSFPHALDRAKEMARERGLKAEPFDHLDRLGDALAHQGLDKASISLDFGLARGIAYYTGLIFEVLHPAFPPDTSLGGGGRYDGLVRALGGDREIPALGFALNLERVVLALESSGSCRYSAGATSRVLLVPQTPAAYPRAVHLASELRCQGRAVQLETTLPTLEAALEYGRRRGMDAVIVVDEAGQTQRYSLKSEAEHATSGTAQ